VSAALHLCGPEDLELLLPLVAAALDEQGIPPDSETLRGALEALLGGLPHGAAWLIGPRRAPVGHVLVSFGWSPAAGGITASLQQFRIRPALRRRGIGTEVLGALATALAGHGVRALEARLPADSPAQGLLARAGFSRQEGYLRLTRLLG